MASNVSIEKCKVCGSENSLYWDLNVNTQEEHQFCDKCGYHYHYQYKRDENNRILRNEKQYPIEDCCFIVKDYQTREIIWQKSIMETENVKEEFLVTWLNGECDFGDESKGSRNVGLKKNDKIHQLLFVCCQIGITDDMKYIKILSPKIDQLEKLGGGVITMKYKDSNLQVQETVKHGISREDLLKQMENTKEKYRKEMDFVKATWFDVKNKRIEEIK